MPKLEFSSDLNVSQQQVWAFHDSIDTLFKLTPPDYHARLDGEAEPMHAGAVYHIRVRRFGFIPIRMASRIVAYNPPEGFEDIQETGKGPFKSWTHRHTFVALPGGRTRLWDQVHYEMPFGLPGAIVDRLFVRHDIRRMFAYRHRITREALENNR